MITHGNKINVTGQSVNLFLKQLSRWIQNYHPMTQQLFLNLMDCLDGQIGHELYFWQIIFFFFLLNLFYYKI